MKELAKVLCGSISVLTMAACGSVSPEATGSTSQADSTLTFDCSLNTNGGTLVNGVCELGPAAVGQQFEGFVSTTPITNTLAITSGQLPPGLVVAPFFVASGLLIIGTPTETGTFTFNVHDSTAPTADQLFSITVDPPLPLTISFPVGACCDGGTVGSFYLQNFALSGGVAPYTWTVDGALPPGVIQDFEDSPGNTLDGTPTEAGTFKFTISVTDGAGQTARKKGSITISR